MNKILKNYSLIIPSSVLLYPHGYFNLESSLLKYLYTKYYIYNIIKYRQMENIDAWQVIMDVMEENFDGNDILKGML